MGPDVSAIACILRSALLQAEAMRWNIIPHLCRSRLKYKSETGEIALWNKASAAGAWAATLWCRGLAEPVAADELRLETLRFRAALLQRSRRTSRHFPRFLSWLSSVFTFGSADRFSARVSKHAAVVWHRQMRIRQGAGFSETHARTHTRTLTHTQMHSWTHN